VSAIGKGEWNRKINNARRWLSRKTSIFHARPQKSQIHKFDKTAEKINRRGGKKSLAAKI
jgi:hypothetical protein